VQEAIGFYKDFIVVLQVCDFLLARLQKCG
jgi:hypothetical protein